MGLGTAMATAHLYVGWTNSTGGYTVASCPPTLGHAMPAAASTQDITVVALAVAAPLWAKTSFSFARKTVQSSSSVLQTSQWIYAASSTPPRNQDLVTATFDQHDDDCVGQLGKVDFLTISASPPLAISTQSSILPLPARLTYYQLVLLHAALMFVAWGVAPFVGIYIARHLKHIGHRWYVLHLLVFILVTLSFSIVGFLAILLFRPLNTHFNTPHQKLGIAIFCIMFLQIVLGFVINKLYTPQRTRVPWYDLTHRWMGRLVVCAGLANIVLGLMEFREKYGLGNEVYLMFAVWLVVVLGFFGFTYLDSKTTPQNLPKSAEHP